MNHILVFDLETTSLLTKIEDALPRRICQLSYIITNSLFDPVIEKDMLIKLEKDEHISRHNQTFHGIHERMSRLQGIPFSQAIETMNRDMEEYHVNTIAGYNIISFDIPFLKTVCEEKKLSYPFEKGGFDFIDLFAKEEIANLVQLPPTARMKMYGHGDKFKSPTLTELYQFFFQERFMAHNALYDVQATIRCIKEAIRRGINVYTKK